MHFDPTRHLIKANKFVLDFLSSTHPLPPPQCHCNDQCITPQAGLHRPVVTTTAQDEVDDVCEDDLLQILSELVEEQQSSANEVDDTDSDDNQSHNESVDEPQCFAEGAGDAETLTKTVYESQQCTPTDNVPDVQTDMEIVVDTQAQPSIKIDVNEVWSQQSTENVPDVQTHMDIFDDTQAQPSIKIDVNEVWCQENRNTDLNSEKLQALVDCVVRKLDLFMPKNHSSAAMSSFFAKYHFFITTEFPEIVKKMFDTINKQQYMDIVQLGSDVRRFFSKYISYRKIKQLNQR
jgi:hypothetical protein